MCASARLRSVMSPHQAASALTGNEFANRIVGGSGYDTLSGGLGKDVLAGGDGADKFVFASVADSNALARDIILDFAQGGDKIDLSAIDAVQGGSDSAFNFVGSAALQNAGDLRAYASGANTVVTADVNGDHAPDLLIRAARQRHADGGGFHPVAERINRRSPRRPGSRSACPGARSSRR